VLTFVVDIKTNNMEGKQQEELVAEKIYHNGDHKNYTAVHTDANRLWVPLGKLTWGAIFAGVLVTAVTQMLLSLLGVGIGLSAVNAITDTDPMKELGVGSILWWSISMLVSLFLGGWTAGKISKAATRPFLTWHGLITWCTFTVISFFILTSSARRVVAGAGNILGTALTAGASLSNKPADLDISNITGDANSLLYPYNDAHLNPVSRRFMGNNRDDDGTGTLMEDNKAGTATSEKNKLNTDRTKITTNGRKTDNELSAVESNRITPQANTQVRNPRLEYSPFYMDQVRNFFSERNVNNPEGRKALVRTISRATGMTQAEADSKVNEWVDSYGRLKADARIKADNAAKAAARASIIVFFALIIGALVTVWGARASTYEKFTDIKINDRKTQTT
jgi:hypothetical protein